MEERREEVDQGKQVGGLESERKVNPYNPDQENWGSQFEWKLGPDGKPVRTGLVEQSDGEESRPEA